ncbi:Maf family protein [Aliifodinibius sp. S!AR15-10]|uniref:Maf family protein n=1 Tax=Aliifodinibius sp. S!AR15-10 TaxID=2950437 RepID=UPI0028703D31|nr:Maf family protein [Aliifodinibius sp. S!AR15-10]
MKIILASGSPRRKQLLKQINVDFTVQVSNADEQYDATKEPADIVQMLAMRKAEQVADENDSADVLVIGADTIVVKGQAILEKPETTTDAEEMLLDLSDTTHQVLTGVAIVKSFTAGNKREVLTFFESTDVTFGKLDKFEIREYVASGSPMDKAGAYGIQDDWGALFVKHIKGDFYNVVGLPLHSLYQKLKIFAPELVSISINSSTP